MYKKILLSVISSVVFSMVFIGGFASANTPSATVEIQLNNIKTQQELMKCLLLMGAENKQKCTSGYEDAAKNKASELEKSLEAFQPTFAKQKDLKGILEGCAKDFKGFNENPNYATANNVGCTKDVIEKAHDAVKDEIKAEREKCDGNKDCLDKVDDSAKDVDQAMNNMMAAISATIAFCATVPEPNTCAAFAALQILMALLKSGGGSGGDGSDNDDGECKGSGCNGGPKPEPKAGKKANGLVVSESGKYKCSQEGTTLLCKSPNKEIKLTKFYGGAQVSEFKLNGVGDDYNKPLKDKLESHNGNISSAMKSYGKDGILGGESTDDGTKFGVVFCIEEIEGVKVGGGKMTGVLVYETQAGSGQYIFSISTSRSACSND